MYAERKGWPLTGIDVTLTYVVKDKNTRWIDRLITLHGVDDDQRAKLAEIAEKTPVTRAVRAGTEIRTTTTTASDDRADSRHRSGRGRDERGLAGQADRGRRGRDRRVRARHVQLLLGLRHPVLGGR